MNTALIDILRYHRRAARVDAAIQFGLSLCAVISPACTNGESYFHLAAGFSYLAAANTGATIALVFCEIGRVFAHLGYLSRGQHPYDCKVCGCTRCTEEPCGCYDEGHNAPN